MGYEPILDPGLHDFSENEIENQFLSDFGSSTTRQPLINGLKNFFEVLKNCGIRFEVWLDGSFTTTKENPGDIDLVVFAEPDDMNRLPDMHKGILQAIFGDRAGTKSRFGCDVLFAPADDVTARSYWRGWYGFDRDENPKGIAKICLTNEKEN